MLADVDLGHRLAGDHRLGARDVRDLVEHGPAGAVGGPLRVVGSHGAAEVDHVLHGLRPGVDQTVEVAGRRRVQGHAATVPTLVGMATSESPPVESAPGLSRTLGLAVAAGLLGAFVAARITGATSPLELADPGVLVRWGVPLVSSVSTLAAAATVGLLGLAAFLAPERATTQRRVQATRYAASAAAVWAVAALLEVVLTFADLAGTPLDLGRPVRPARLVHLDPRDHPGAADQRAHGGRRGGLRPADDAAGADGVARAVHPGRGRRPRPHRSRGGLGEPRGRRQLARRAPARGRRVGRRAARPRRDARVRSAPTSARPWRATRPWRPGASGRSRSPGCSRPGSGWARSTRCSRPTARSSR